MDISPSRPLSTITLILLLNWSSNTHRTHPIDNHQNSSISYPYQCFLHPRCKKAWDWKKIHTFIFIQLILTANINCTVDNYLPVTLAFPETPRRPDKLSCITRQNPLVSIGFYYSKTLIYRASWGRGIRPGKSRCTVYRGTISIAVHT